jgi:hypothetical protein
MTTTTLNDVPAPAPAPAPGLLRRAASWPLTVLRALGEVYRKGLTLPALAPAIFAIVVLPEGAQHVAEIQLGMFTSREAFMALSADATRMAFGAVKVAGLILAILLTARFWHTGSVRAAVLMPPRDLARTVFAVAIGFAASLPAEWAATTQQPPFIYWPVVSLSWLVSFLLLVYLIGALVGDRGMTLRASFTRGWKVLPLLALLVVAAFWPAATLHAYAHKWALGASPAAVWTLMAGDALLVGLMATLTGSALAVAYRIGAAKS